jgi:FkbM family methyltransferase
MSLVFKKSPVRNQPYIDYSLWLYDVYNHYFKDKHDGFLVELGVGKTIDWVSMNESPRLLTEEEFKTKYVRGWSNTIELLENGWSGIYVEPITEFLTNELSPLLQTILPKGQFDKIKLCPYAASNSNHIAKIIDCETISIVNEQENNLNIIPYDYKNRFIKCKKTSDILEEVNCPRDIDIMSIDVEGHELHAIAGIDFTKHRPKMIICEIIPISVDDISKLLPSGYKLIAKDYLNGVWIDS